MFAATIGFFDGVHLGHRCLLGQLCAVARERGLGSLVVTFDRHPRQVFGGYVPRLLTTTEEKLPLLRSAGVSDIRVLRFDLALSRLSAREFVRKMRDEMGVRCLVMGYDHRFGHDGGAGLDYSSIANEEGVELLRARELDGLKASSSAARRCLEAGDVEGAGKVLGYAYRLGGRVVHGKGVGRQLGFPTANLDVPEEKLVPACGVYAVRAELRDGGSHAAMLNIGNRPTMRDGGAVSVEVHLLDFVGDLYGETLSVELVSRLRGERRFCDAGALAAQLRDDALQVRRLNALK
ncbi:MAG: riboflavin biosynthesis protein RibF [Prevotellaceae bacterium]|nr:riboflavin biosynthesis protein RibF [Prevotellaceae bacterium]